MAARAGAGTAVCEAICSATGSLAAIAHVVMNNNYRADMNRSTLTMSLSKSGVAKLTNISQSEWQQLWQDMSQMGAAH